MNQTTEPSPAPPTRVECLASREPAVRRTILAVLFLGIGLWCYSDRNNPKYQWPSDWGNLNQVLGYVLNHWLPYLLVPAGALTLIWMLVQLRKRLVADEEGVGYVGRPGIAWSEVDSLDASRLESKGIVVLHAGGRRMVLDSYYLTNFRELMALVDRHVPVEKHLHEQQS